MKAICARFNVEENTLSNAINKFCKPQGAEYKKDWGVFASAWRELVAHVDLLLDQSSNDWKKLNDLANVAIRAICSIPADLDQTIFDAGSPFTAYCRLRDLFSTATIEVVYVDRYLGPSLFYRYLEHVPESAKIKLVTDSFVLKNKQQDSFKDASKMFAAQRTNFTVSTNNVHDRWLRIDGNMYHVGGSIKDAAVADALTITKLTSQTDNSKLDKCLAGASLWNDAMK